MNQKRSARPQSYHHRDLRRGLVEAALALVNEEQKWDFSLREVARRAGVSHNAPYNHFRDRDDLLAAIATTGFDSLRERILAHTTGVKSVRKALINTAVVYVGFGVENPARYRLMFLSPQENLKDGERTSLNAAVEGARSVLADLIYRGARTGELTVSSRRKEQLEIAVLTAWSTVHGLTMVALDRLTRAPNLPIPELAERVARTVCDGLIRKRIRRSGTKQVQNVSSSTKTSLEEIP
jgi:AcrR family transcriptional regulator